MALTPLLCEQKVKISNKRNISAHEQKLLYLLDDLCLKWGFCLPPDKMATIIKSQIYDARQFAKEVLEAYGMDPDTESKWLNKILELFNKYFY